MKIFLDDKFVELLGSEPVNFLPDVRYMEYSTASQLRKAFESFERKDQPLNLAVWSDKEEKKLVKDFFSLFTRIAAAGGLVRNESGEMLFIFRLGKWDLPKGKLAEKETPEAAALREVKEETGLQEIRITGLLPSTFHIYTRKGKQILKRTYWFAMEAKGAQSLIPQTEEDISEVRWISRGELEKVLENTYGSIKEVVKF